MEPILIINVWIALCVMEEINNWFKKRLYFLSSISLLLCFLLGWPIVVVVLSWWKIRQGVYCDQHLESFVIVSAGLWLLLGFYSLVIFVVIWLWGDVPYASVFSSVGFVVLLCNFGYWIYLQIRFFESGGPNAYCPKDCTCQGYADYTHCCNRVVYGVTLAMIVVMYVCALMLFCYPCWVSLVWSRRARRGLGRLTQWIGTASDYVTHIGADRQRWNRLGLYIHTTKTNAESTHLLS